MTDNRTTELLRKLLDERGVEYDDKLLYGTTWTVNGIEWNAKECDGLLNVWVRNNNMTFTPEQAIAATLGGGKLTADDVLNAVYKHGARWQAIADELNAELDSGTCEIVAQTWEDRGGDEEDTYRYELSCGHTVRMLDCEPLYNCPRCGKAVKR